MEGLVHGWMRFCIEHGKGTAASGVFGAFSVCMRLKTVFEIIGDPCIESFVGAFQDVDDPAQMIFFSLSKKEMLLGDTVKALSNS